MKHSFAAGDYEGAAVRHLDQSRDPRFKLYTAVEGVCPVREGSAYAKKINPVLHECNRCITGRPMPANVICFVCCEDKNAV